MSAIEVKAPDGFEAVRCLNVDTKSWHLFIKRTGDTFSKEIEILGHAWMTFKELDELAKARVELFAQRGF